MSVYSPLILAIFGRSAVKSSHSARVALSSPAQSVRFFWRPVFVVLAFLYFSERKSIKKENFNRKTKEGKEGNS